MYLCTGVYNYTGVQVLIGAQMYRCTNVWVYRCVGVQMYGCTSIYVYKCVDVQVYRCTSIWMYNCTGVQVLFRCTSV